MILPPRTLAIRLFFWTALLAYAIWILRDKRADDVFGSDAPPPTVDARVPLARPVTHAPPDGAAPPLVDIEAAMGAMDAATTAIAACGVTGTFSVRLDATGLAEAWILPTSPLSQVAATCAAGAAWAPVWPRTTQSFETERAVAGPHTPASPSGTVK
ncbi:MAG: hypothetical protein V4850_31855 [Myxococcota bacterium]